MAEKFRTEAERIEAIKDAEAMSRREESRATIVRSILAQNPNDEGAKQMLAEVEADETKARDRLHELTSTEEVKDLSGAVRGLSDSKGNFAPNIAVAQAGGTGVEASNTVAGGEKQATSPTQVQTPAAATAEAAKLAADEAVKAAEQAKVSEAEAAKAKPAVAAPATPVVEKK